ncbi:NAD-dependent epimerase/dehydratase family protein [Mucilaginibacter sp. BT774]|uniref:NAD-dependent epimerase/dehydratase family protein n=1 Tax=Mucilaginibacter sp. BT774 TaxID=3062276 RepID=UPI002676FE25|nr:NAD-dependent epimerase/dehydratase family protein [Mucilaginibacter sp. BT774]MDO3629043.1 NAD-dependent epimerase/dehydratase family protein [Mucilaginibacter sp. BT774]
MKDKILVIGANGQIGTALIPFLEEIYGEGNVIASDINNPVNYTGVFEHLDATKADNLSAVIKKHDITQIYHLAAILSARGEADPVWAWNINMQTSLSVLQAAREHKLNKLFIPSSIAVFGPSSGKEMTQQNACLEPSTVYGVSKVATENWCSYYYHKYGIDVRSLRYPGVVSHQSMPGGGTTDYAVDIFHKAINGEKYTCYLKPDTALPMIYIDDALRATIKLMEAPKKKITVRTSYNLAGLSFTPDGLYQNIKNITSSFEMEYQPDFRQAIADSWPGSIDDSIARNDWEWQPEFDLSRMSRDMFFHLAKHKAFASQP